MEPNARAGRREWVGLAVLALAALLVSIDVFVLLLALPHLSADLGADATQQLWIMDVYGFLLSGFLITMGGLGDRIGRRRLLLGGAAAFGVASVVAAYSPSPEALIVARALLGVAGATVAPSTLSLISTMFRDARQRSQAFGVWLACFIGGAALGPIVGGTLLEHFWWGSAFLLGVPAMLLLLVLGPILLPEYRAPEAGRLDLASVALSLAAVLPIVYGLKELARTGWHAAPVLATLAGVLVGVAFVRRQRRLADPLLDLRLLGNRVLSTALAGTLAATLLMGAIMMFLTQHLQLVQGLSPLHTGLWMLPSLFANMLSFQLSPLLARRIRPAVLIAAGLTVSVCGLLVLTRVGTGHAPATLITGWALIGLGAGPLVTLATELVVGSAPQAKAGSAAAMNETSGEFGYALGIAVLGSIGTALYRAEVEVPAGVPDAARESLTGAAAVADDLPGPVREALLDSARAAFTTGLHTVALLSAVALAGMAVLIAVMLRHVPPIGASEPKERPESGSEPDSEPAPAAAGH
ncbi:MFS transporter [Actinomadura viridis]|uniref:DHA2 family multidrug resistance protein-like MFS transporter n=1 Tax=Actinomadura viridis TaxID=58110 RepID=A0A931GKW3_9ACTN|nr:MFS transporter [Actinomadura viridis]MBG6091338.1 DHA2 family multidrug resistance protein-like MFS transporter [Actinomadura viridis]